MFLSLKNKIETENTDPELLLTVPLLDAPHLRKSFKASFSNWILKLFNERGCLAFLHTLRNKSTRDEIAEMKNLIPKNDYVRNKDRQDPMTVLKLSDDQLLNKLGKLCKQLFRKQQNIPRKIKLAYIQTLLIFVSFHTITYS